MVLSLHRALLIAGLLAVSCAACDSNKVAAKDGATVPVQVETSAEPKTPETPKSHEYASREGNVFYYADADGSLVGAIDLGRLPQDQDFRRMLRKGDRAVQFDGRVFAAVSPDSDVVRIMEMRPGEQIFRHLQNVSLSSDTVAAKALRDSLAGHLTFPSAAALAGDDLDTEAGTSDAELGNAKADSYGIEESEDPPPDPPPE